MQIHCIIEAKSVFDYLAKRNLLGQYKKVKNFLLSGFYDRATFKKREPKALGVYYFRINRQFRALCYFEDTTLVVFDIDNHQ